MFYLTRKRFLDQLMDADDLRAAAEMWRGWFLLRRRAAHLGEVGRYRLEAQIYGFARQDSAALQVALQDRLSRFAVDVHASEHDPDMVQIIGGFVPGGQPCDIALWLHILSDPEVSGLCVLLRIHIEASAGSSCRITSTGTFVMCGSACEGRLIVKAVWHFSDPQFDRLHHRADWDDSEAFMEALEVFRRVETTLRAADPLADLTGAAGLRRLACATPAEAQNTASTLVDLGFPAESISVEASQVSCMATVTACAQAAAYLRMPLKSCSNFFVSPGIAKQGRYLARLVVEFPGDHSPAAFAVRTGAPLAVGVVAAGAALFLNMRE